jgi:hypothetical protein
VKKGWLFPALALIFSCSSTSGGLGSDAQAPGDSGSKDLGTSADASAQDAAETDAMLLDATTHDAQSADAAQLDGQAIDSGSLDATTAADAQAGDAGSFDAATHCARPQDCAGSGMSLEPACMSSAFSCIASQCVWECAGGQRSCALSRTTTCTECLGRAPECDTMVPSCLLGDGHMGVVEATSCPQLMSSVGANIATTRDTAHPGCAYSINFANTGIAIGAYDELSDGTMIGIFGGLGPICTGMLATTGALRIYWSCADCQISFLYQ